MTFFFVRLRFWLYFESHFHFVCSQLAAAAFASKQPLTEAHVKELLSIARHDLILPTASGLLLVQSQHV
jgi:hypothetical protein